jgi:hypothetical protein
MEHLMLGDSLTYVGPNFDNPDHLNVHIHRKSDLKHTKSHIAHDLVQELQHKPSLKHLISLNNDQCPYLELDLQLFDENSYFEILDTDSNASESSTAEIYLNLRFKNQKAKTLLVELNPITNFFNYKTLNESLFETTEGEIRSIKGSRLIRGESVALTSKNSIYLMGETFGKIKMYDSIDDDNHFFNYQSIEFGSQPREFIYANSKRLTCIDCRIKKPHSKEIFKVKHENRDRIQKTNVVCNNFNLHLICCDKTVNLVDQRYPNHALMTWSSYLNKQCVFMKNYCLNLDGDKTINKNYVLLSDSSDLFMFRFNEKLHNSEANVLKLDSSLEFKKNLPKSYDKRLDRCIDSHLNKPIVALSSCNYQDKIAVFHVGNRFN